ncbi:MAG: VacJ family lipoprotein [Comamonas sp.]|jgi:phospholipid-binding lipoprotein MlaA|nr:VacJ family lipoprotein [Comamonas sp.]
MTNEHRWHGLCRTGAALALAVLAGCATGPNAHPQDPFEPYNRAMTHFNDGVDQVLLVPAATVYKEALPRPVRTGVSNFFANLGDLWSFVNNVLQARGQAAADSLARFGINTFIGMGGLFDVASEAGIERHRQDFGLTLAHWGMSSGPYLVLPLLGPSTLRDTAMLPVDTWGDLASHARPVATRNGLYVLRFVDRRASLLGATAIRDAAALDPYTFTRDLYLDLRQQRAGQRDAGDDGKLPEED